MVDVAFACVSCVSMTIAMFPRIWVRFTKTLAWCSVALVWFPWFLQSFQLPLQGCQQLIQRLPGLRKPLHEVCKALGTFEKAFNDIWDAFNGPLQGVPWLFQACQQLLQCFRAALRCTKTVSVAKLRKCCEHWCVKPSLPCSEAICWSDDGNVFSGPMISWVTTYTLWAIRCLSYHQFFAEFLEVRLRHDMLMCCRVPGKLRVVVESFITRVPRVVCWSSA